MPRITESQTVAYAHCRDMLCAGYSQEEVGAVNKLFERTIGEMDPKAGIFSAIVETSWVDLEFADPDDVSCEYCGGTREISGTPRPTYQRLSGHPQDGLLTMRGYDSQISNSAADEKAAAAAAEQNRKIAEMQEQMEALMAKLGDAP